MSTAIESPPASTAASAQVQPRHVLVTGSTGFVGRNLVSKLAMRGHRVTALTRPGQLGPDTRGVSTWQVNDLAEAGQASSRMAGVETIVHCAARVHLLHETSANPLAAFRRVNVDGTLAVARCAAAAGVKRFVNFSTIGVNGSRTSAAPFRADDPPAPRTPYAQSKWESEQALDELAGRTGMEVVHVRPPMVYGAHAPGNFALLSRAVRSGVPLPVGSLGQMRSFVGIGNLCDLVQHVVERHAACSGPLLVSDGQDLSTAEFVRKMVHALRSRTVLLPVPEPVLRMLAALVGRGEQVEKMAVRLVIDLRPTIAALGWRPPHTVDQELDHALGTPHKTRTT